MDSREKSSRCKGAPQNSEFIDSNGIDDDEKEIAKSPSCEKIEKKATTSYTENDNINDRESSPNPLHGRSSPAPASMGTVVDRESSPDPLHGDSPPSPVSMGVVDDRESSPDPLHGGTPSRTASIAYVNDVGSRPLKLRLQKGRNMGRSRANRRS
ncbi:hypothetical protein G7Y89_g6437 [Cudoniella acicularis]|uniref:Uncharacterized protein n=1 Tax=Cudoniella acicularis TaxID=354080 RepID=A0A8H4W5I4_9HELO|nr:hypothetical protein G7Y89_g6437 [Cudoniella acicularis]